MVGKEIQCTRKPCNFFCNPIELTDEVLVAQDLLAVEAAPGSLTFLRLWSSHNESANDHLVNGEKDGFTNPRVRKESDYGFVISFTDKECLSPASKAKDYACQMPGSVLANDMCPFFFLTYVLPLLPSFNRGGAQLRSFRQAF